VPPEHRTDTKEGDRREIEAHLSVHPGVDAAICSPVFITGTILLLLKTSDSFLDLQIKNRRKA
jgi:hypothetical protein